MRKIALNLLVLGVAVLAGGSLLEFGIRLFAPQFDPSGSVEFRMSERGVPLGPKDTTRRQYKNTGDYDVEVSFNRYGLRDHRDLAHAKPDDIFVVGDSYSMGWGVEEGERYSDQLEERLQVSVFNISIPTDFDGYRRLLEYAVDRGAPVRRIVVGVCMENDLGDYEGVGDESTERTPAELLSLAKSWLIQHSAIYLALTALVHQQPVLREIAIRSGLLVDNIAGMARNQFDKERIERASVRLRDIVEPYDAWILVIPSRGLWVGGNEAIERQVHETFVQSLRDLGFRIIDMRPIFEATGNPMQFHFAQDGHWNAKGHLLAADALSRAIGASAPR